MVGSNIANVGVILAVNEAWRNFAARNGGDPAKPENDAALRQYEADYAEQRPQTAPVILRQMSAQAADAHVNTCV